MNQGLSQNIDEVGAALNNQGLAQDINNVGSDFEIIQLGFVRSIPANGQINVNSQPVFQWLDPENRGLYKLIFDTDPNYGDPTEIWTTAKSYTPPSPLPDGIYNWKVEARELIDRPPIVEQVVIPTGDEGSQAGDKQALDDLWASTQGENIPVLASEDDLPPVDAGNAISFHHNQEIYLINGDIYRVWDGPHIWENTGPVWKNSAGWNNGDVTMVAGDYDVAPVGVRIEEMTIDGVTELRVTGIDFQKLSYSAAENVTAGNNLVGTLPASMGNLRQLRDRLNLKQNFLYGDIPHSMYTYPHLKRWSMAGQCAELDLDRKTTWYESNHPRDHGAEDHDLIGGKRYQHSNKLGGTIPPQVKQMVSLKLFECRSQRLRGNCPPELLQMPNLRALFIAGQRGSSSTDLPVSEQSFGGPFPQDWSQMISLQWCHISQGYSGRKWEGQMSESFNQLPSITHVLVRVSTGQIPTFPNTSDIRYMGARTEGSTFPIGLFRVENRRLSKFDMGFINMTGIIPEKDLPTDDENRLILNHFGVYNNDLEGTIPQWVRDLRNLIITNIGLNNFTGTPPWEINTRSTRLFRIDNNNFTDKLRGVSFSKVGASGTVTSVVSSDTLELSIPTDPIYTGTITESSSDWIRNVNGTHLEEWGSGGYTVRVIIPDGEDVVFTPRMYSDNTTYIWSPSSVDTSGLAGYDYEVSVKIVDRVAGFMDGSGFMDGTGEIEKARFVSSTNGQNFTFDRPITAQVGDVVNIYTESDLLFLYLQSNNLYGAIPEYYGYIPTDTEYDVKLDDNDIGWDENSNLVDFHVPDFTNAGKYVGGQTIRLRINNNRLLPYHILPNHTANQTINSYSFGDQKPFSPDVPYDYDSEGDSLAINMSQALDFSHVDDSYEWRKGGANGTPITSSGDGRVTVTDTGIIFDSLEVGDTDTYTLVITNSNLPGEEFVSGDQIITITDLDINQ